MSKPMKEILKDVEAQRKLHIEVFGRWLTEKGWSQYYNDNNWVKKDHTHHEIGVPVDIAVMFELGLKKGLRPLGHTIALIDVDSTIICERNETKKMKSAEEILASIDKMIAIMTAHLSKIEAKDDTGKIFLNTLIELSRWIKDE